MIDWKRTYSKNCSSKIFEIPLLTPRSEFFSEKSSGRGDAIWPPRYYYFFYPTIHFFNLKFCKWLDTSLWKKIWGKILIIRRENDYLVTTSRKRIIVLNKITFWSFSLKISMKVENINLVTYLYPCRYTVWEICLFVQGNTAPLLLVKVRYK